MVPLISKNSVTNPKKLKVAKIWEIAIKIFFHKVNFTKIISEILKELIKNPFLYFKRR